MPTTLAVSTRETLLTAAANLLQNVGYASFSFRDLATAVGIRSASIHYHFPAKANLGVALVEWFRAHMRDHERDMIAAHPNVRKRIMAIAEHTAELTCGAGKSCPIHSLLSEYAVLPPTVQAAVDSWIDDKLKLIAAWLDEGRKAGDLSFPGSPLAQARIVWSVFAHGTQLVRTHHGPSFIALVRQLVDTMTPDKTS